MGPTTHKDLQQPALSSDQAPLTTKQTSLEEQTSDKFHESPQPQIRVRSQDSPLAENLMPNKRFWCDRYSLFSILMTFIGALLVLSLYPNPSPPKIPTPGPQFFSLREGIVSSPMKSRPSHEQLTILGQSQVKTALATPLSSVPIVLGSAFDKIIQIWLENTVRVNNFRFSDML